MLITQELLPEGDLGLFQAMHFERIALITKLHNAAINKESQNIITLLQELLNTTNKHFSYENEQMKSAAFQEYHRHKFEHDKELLELESIMSFYEMTQDADSVAAYLEDSLTPWIVEHVESMDLQTVAFLKENSS